MERNHLRYLLATDPDIQNFYSNQSNVEIYMQPFLFSFGLLGHNADQIKEFDADI